jgi:UDPglucose--hexose-1-phosphate uridylyltransferase
VHQLALRKPDGRALTLYSRRPIDAALTAPSPFAQPLEGKPHMRWHPLRGEWVTYAAYRQDRTFLPPPEYNPFAVTVSDSNPTEVPQGDWDIAVFDNRFPSLDLDSAHAPSLAVPTRPAKGKCEVVVFTQDPDASLAALPLDHIELLISVWADRTKNLGAAADIQYVLPFENRGAEVGVTLHHPHGQIYAYPVVPPIPARMQSVAASHYAQHGRGPLADLIEDELRHDERVIYRGDEALAFVPVCARYPYEVWIAPIHPVESFRHLSSAARLDLARALKTVLLKYDALWQRPFPYLMAWYQAPIDGAKHPEWHLHAQFYPPYRTQNRLKYLAGTELAAGLYAMDALPEEKARELRDVEVTIE